MMNMQGIMKQAQMMQKKMEETQAKLAQEEVCGTSGGGAVKIIINGKMEMKKIEINPEAVTSDDVEMLEDLILTAFNDAKKKADELMENGMKEVTGGMNLGGLKLPF